MKSRWCCWMSSCSILSCWKHPSASGRRYQQRETLHDVQRMTLHINRVTEDMIHATFTFYGDLNDLLPAAQRQMPLPFALDGPTAVKHPIESLGVPHPEVELIAVSGEAVDFSYLVQPDDRVAVYPATWITAEALPPNITLIPLRPPLPQPVRFVLDTHLGQLATYLRVFGCDTLYRNDYDDLTLAHISAAEDRLLLTRDRGLLKRKLVVYGHCVRHPDPAIQVVDVLRRYVRRADLHLWRRCLRCNGQLVAVAKAAVLEQLEPKTRRYYDEFYQCTQCGQVYWQGSHVARMAELIQQVMAALPAE